MNDDVRALMLLSLVDGVGAVRQAAMIDALRTRGLNPGALLELEAGDLVAEGWLTSDQAERFNAPEVWERVKGWVAALEEQRVDALALRSPRYPEHLARRLGTHAPPLLYTHGDPTLMDRPGVAFSGARDTSARGLEIAGALAGAAVQAGFAVVSGGARGTDSTAHAVAVEAGGTTVVVLVEGMLSARARELIASVDPDRVLVLSQFEPDAPWQRWRAMDRNGTILGLADRLVVIEAGATGGTLATGREALRREMAVWALGYGEPVPTAAGNAALFARGARPIPVTDTGEVTIPDALFAEETPATDAPTQPTLF